MDEQIFLSGMCHVHRFELRQHQLDALLLMGSTPTAHVRLEFTEVPDEGDWDSAEGV